MGEMSPKAKNIYDQRDRKWLAERVVQLEEENARLLKEANLIHQCPNCGYQMQALEGGM